uniref:ATP synthase F0 subunit 8 n=1 Tax=Bolma rugosa TaxID=335776 RepID=A0A0X9Q1Q7_9VEST|nr:ATP synthase F0 subunit 8 [Bolma rugosa]AMA07320.1 ATP synthase F0 subunit 8 [Bolma rugosa]
MPQLAPLNWLFLFFLFWSMVGLSSTLIWWSFKTEYKVQVTESFTSGSENLNKFPKSWDW